VDQCVKRIPVTGVVDVADAHQDVIDGLYGSSFHQLELVFEGEEHVFHILPDLGDQVEAFFKQLLHQRGEITFVSVALALEALKQGFEYLMVVVCHVGRGDEKAGQLPVLVDDQVQLEAKEPASGAFSSGSDSLKDFMGVDAEIIADGQLLGVDIVVAGAD